MAESKAKKYIVLIRIFLCLGGACFLVGFFIATISTNTVFTGITVMITGGIVSAVIAIIPTVRLIQLRNEEKENRIKRLEEEVELLKKK